MANSANFQVVPCAALMQGLELNFTNLYLHHTPAGSKPNQSTIINKNDVTGLGTTVVNNWTIYDGLGSDAKVVARAQGLHIFAGRWHNSYSLVFENERFKGSTLQVMGVSVEDGQWAIVGGTGEFSMANGVIDKKFHEQRTEGNIIQLTVRGFCPSLKGTRGIVTKIGPWGGKGGNDQDIAETPMRLESITVSSGVVIDSISFSYIDQAGQKRTSGRLGGPKGSPNTITLASSEIVKEITGTYGSYEGLEVITSIKFVTSVKTYGPFGKENGTPFKVPVQNNSSVVGFFGRGGKYVDAVGVYVCLF